MPITQAGALNTTALIVPDLYIQIVPPQNLMINGVPTNTIGFVGSAQWGPVNVAAVAGNMQQFAQQFGAPQIRKYDMGTHVATAVLQGASSFKLVRVTDGGDTAATGSGPAGCITFTSLYTGTLGNAITVQIAAGSQANTWRAIVGLPGLVPEGFDNLSAGIYSNTIVPGTGATAVPSLTFSAPTIAGGVRAVGSASLITVGTPTIGAAGTGYLANDLITLANGVIVKVATVSSGAILTFAAQGTAGTAVGSIVGAGTAVPTNPLAQVSTSGAGTGATVTVAWGLGPITMSNPGTLYSGSPTATLGGTAGSGTVTPIVAIWGGVTNAINNGTTAAGNHPSPSGIITATVGAGTTAPTAATYTLTGGQDGASGVTAAIMVGADSAIGGARTGMYALRGQKCSIGDLCDMDTSTQYTTVDAFALSEGIYMVQTLPAGTSITSGVTAKQTAGLDSYASKLQEGDWIWWNDPVNQSLRLVSPQGFVAGRLANLSPEQSSLNKQLYGVVGSQKSGIAGFGPAQQYSSADLQVMFLAGIDVIANPQPGGFYWGVRAGHNSSSNASIHGDNYTRMVNYIATTLNAGMGGYVGQLINQDLFRRVRATLLSFLGNLLQQGLLGTTDGSLPYSVVCDASNNPFTRTALGYLQADVQVRLQAINEFFLVNIEAGQTVQVLRQTLPPVAA